MLQQQSLLLQGPRRLQWVTDPLPSPGPVELCLRTRAGAISIGTELPAYRGDARPLQPVPYPVMTGYESLAEVVACGSAVQKFGPGDRVLAFYGHRTAVVTAATRVVPVPPDISDRLALLLILACDTAKGVSKLTLQAASRILITGGGAIGLLTLFNLHARGIRQVDVVEPLANRRRVALALGARQALDPDRDDIPQSQYDFGFECSSRNCAFQILQDAVVPNSQLCVLSDGNLEPFVLAPSFHLKELNIVGSSDGLDYGSYAQWYWDVLRRHTYPLEQLFEQTAPARALPELFEDMAQNVAPPLKVLVQYGGKLSPDQDPPS